MSPRRADDQLLYFNGINAATGEYLLAPKRPEEISRLALGERPDEGHLSELKFSHERATQGTFGPRAGVDPKNLAETGWAVLFAHDADPAIKEALGELLEHRRTQASARDERFYNEFTGADGYKPGQSHRRFLAEHKTSPGQPADARAVPYYVLIVGSPEAIPYSFQYQLDVMYATGRLHFDSPDEYAQYARSVVEAESGKLALPRRAAFFGVKNPADRATSLSAEYLVKPLAKKLAGDHSDWTVETLLDRKATKAKLQRLLGGPDTPALLFSASHGMGFPNGAARQLDHQGALLCQDWPGPVAWRKEIPQDFYLAADDITDDARLLGLVAIHFACFGAGTPRLDDFAHASFTDPEAIAPHAFVAKLPRRLLGHPKGGALAVVGHVERAWGYSFHWPQVGQQTQVFEDLFVQLLDGHPIGSAMECFGQRYAALSSDLSVDVEQAKFGAQVDELALANMWTANNDARSYAIVGDPAVRLAVAAGESTAAERPEIKPVVQSRTRSQVVVEAEGEANHSGATPRSAMAEGGPPTARAFDAEGAEAYGLLDVGGLREARAALSDGLQRFATQLGQALSQLADEAATVEVRTYVSEDLPGVDYADGKLTGPAKLRAYSRVGLHGRFVVCVPEEQGQLDQALWSLHTDMVQRAITMRLELIRSATTAAAELLTGLQQLA